MADLGPDLEMINEAREQLAFLETRYASEAADARRAMTYTGGNWSLICKATIDLDVRDDWGRGGMMGTDSDPFVAEHIVRHRPRAVLRSVDARLRLLDRARILMGHEEWYPRFLGECIVYDLVQAYDGEDGFRPSWRAEERSHRDVVLDGEVVRNALEGRNG